MAARPGVDRPRCRRWGAASRPPAPPRRSCACRRPRAAAVDSLRGGATPAWDYARSVGLRAAGGIAPTLPSPASWGGKSPAPTLPSPASGGGKSPAPTLNSPPPFLRLQVVDAVGDHLGDRQAGGRGRRRGVAHVQDAFLFGEDEVVEQPSVARHGLRTDTGA